MTNKIIADGALQLIRQRIKKEDVRSSNKWRSGETKEDANRRRKTYSFRATMMWAEPPLPSAEEGAKKLFEAGIANCNDLAWVAADEIRKSTECYSLVTTGADHVFVAVGNDFEQDPPAHQLKKWRPAAGSDEGEVYICDPWADISVAARDYADAWDKQMRQWNKDDMKIGVSPNRWIAPKEWVGLISRSEKHVLTSRGVRSYGNSGSDSRGDAPVKKKRWLLACIHACTRPATDWTD